MILGIESSCDESALALFDPNQGMVGEWMHSQIVLHQKHGGVVPDLASREHLANFPPLLERLHQALEGRKVTRVTVTCGPGLAGCLAIGVALGKSLALAWEAPLVGVNHLRGHAFSPFIHLHREDPPHFSKKFKNFLPHLGLIVSGGNTLLFKIERDESVVLLAQTVDDAAGEAFDKGARLLGLGYPGGPVIERIARRGNACAYPFPRAFYQTNELKFSFSGLKTSLRYRLEKMSDPDVENALPDLCASYEEAIIAALVRKTEQALKQSPYASLGLSGGVANNESLRAAFNDLAKRRGVSLLMAEPSHTGDNAAMVAFAAYANKKGTIPAPNLFLAFYPALTLA